MPFFTVVIPLYNKQNYVEATLKSILDQTFDDYEVLVVDDCSTDNSVQVVTPYLSDTIRLISHPKNGGLSASRNTGIRHASSHWIAFLDADDTWEPTFLACLYEMIQQFPEEVIFATNYQEVYPGGNIRLPKNNTSGLKLGETALITDFFKRNRQQGFFIHSGICFHKKVYETVGYYDETIDFAEDLDFNIRAFHQFNLIYNNSRLVNYTMQSENQLTHSSILGKKVPDYDQYEPLTAKNKDLKSYLDFERYVMAKHLKTDGDTVRYKQIICKINPENLNYKQKILLQLPAPLLRWIGKTKGFLLKNGIRVSSYD